MPLANTSGNSTIGEAQSNHAPLDSSATASNRRPSPQMPSNHGPQLQVSSQQTAPPARLQRSHSAFGQRTPSQSSSSYPSFTFATSAAAAATCAKNRPKLNLSTSYNNQTNPVSLPSPPSAISGQSVPPSAIQGRRRLWFRKKAGGPATSLLVDPYELVDDVKSRIVMKYPTSLLQNCDPADLVVTVFPHSSARVELQPDENIWAVLDRHYSSGMTINDALELSLPAASLQPPSTLQASAPTRTAIQRARSYSNNSHYQGYSSLSPSAGPPPMPQSHHGSSEPNTPLSISPHGASPGAHSSTGGHSPASDTRQDSRQNTSVLLMPRQLAGPSGPLSVNAERELDGHATTLVPLTGEPRTDAANSTPNWSEVNNVMSAQSSSNAVNHQGNQTTPGTASSALQTSALPTPGLSCSGGLASLQMSKSSVVPQINVLIVEDNKINQLILERFLQRKNVRCAVATNGREALEKWRAGGFHLILMDIQLPEMSGLEVTKEIRRLEIVNGIGAFPQAFRSHELPAAPAHEDVLPKSEGGFRSPVIIVALTASSEMLDKSEALAAGCNDFLTKPVNLTWLEQKITEWGCMQALIDYAGWKQWSADSPYHSLSRAEVQAKQAEQQQQQQPQTDRQNCAQSEQNAPSKVENSGRPQQNAFLPEQHSQGPIATSI